MISLVIKMYRSDTGQFVAVHDATESVVIHESAEEAFTKLDQHLRANFPDFSAELSEPFKPRAYQHWRPQLAMLLVLAVILTIFAISLRASIRAIAVETRLEMFGGEENPLEKMEQISGRVENLEQEINELTDALTNLDGFVRLQDATHEGGTELAGDIAALDNFSVGGNLNVSGDVLLHKRLEAPAGLAIGGNLLIDVGAGEALRIARQGSRGAGYLSVTGPQGSDLGVSIRTGDWRGQEFRTLVFPTTPEQAGMALFPSRRGVEIEGGLRLSGKLTLSDEAGGEWEVSVDDEGKLSVKRRVSD